VTTRLDHPRDHDDEREELARLPRPVPECTEPGVAAYRIDQWDVCRMLGIPAPAGSSVTFGTDDFDTLIIVVAED
jgi:hypothetical protein